MDPAEATGTACLLPLLLARLLPVPGQPLADSQAPLPDRLVLLDNQTYLLDVSGETYPGVDILKPSLGVHNTAKFSEHLVISIRR